MMPCAAYLLKLSRVLGLNEWRVPRQSSFVDMDFGLITLGVKLAIDRAEGDRQIFVFRSHLVARKFIISLATKARGIRDK